MATYVVLFNWTDQGIKGYKESVSRVDAANGQMAEFGVEIKDIYWTIGGYDLAGIVEAADDESLTKSLLALGAAGNVRTTTLRAFSRAEFEALL